MAVLGIITCEILGEEMASLIAGEHDLSSITIIDDPQAKHLMEALSQRCDTPVQPIPHVSAYLSSGTGWEILIKVMEVGLHTHREKMRRRLRGEALAFERYIDALMLGFGLCGGALTRPGELLDLRCPLFFPREGDSPPADCISICLGGDGEYERERRREAGTYYITAGWSRYWRDALERETAVRREQLSPFFDRRIMARYERILVIDNGVTPRPLLMEGAEKLSHLTNLEICERKGSLCRLSACYREAREAVQERSGDLSGVRTYDLSRG